MTRTVGHRLHEGAIEVFAYARSLPEANALEAALKTVPKSDAYMGSIDIPLPEAPEGHPALADAEDTTDGLNAQTRAVMP